MAPVVGDGFLLTGRSVRSHSKIQVLVLLCFSYRPLCYSLLLLPRHHRALLADGCRQYRTALASAPAAGAVNSAVRRRPTAVARRMSSGDSLRHGLEDSSGRNEAEVGGLVTTNARGDDDVGRRQSSPTRSSALSPSPAPSPPPLYHHWTVCVVPPPLTSSQPVWEAITEARTRLQDPGLYRWPPHVNLLYPFVDCYIHKERAAEGDPNEISASIVTKPGGHDSTSDNNDGGVDAPPSSTSGAPILRRDVLDKLRTACAQIEPFTVQLRQLGTFGSSKRGVLWLDPQCFGCVDNQLATSSGEGFDDTEVTVANVNAPTVSPLVRLQRLLEDEFPFCTAQRNAGNNGSYRPHMTLSHFENVEAALQAQVETDEWWSQLSSHQTDFVLDRIYVLTRKGDDGQFERVAEVRLGRSDSTRDDEMIHCFGPDRGRFPYMPHVEYDWVRDQRMALKKRRNNGGGRGRRRRRSSGSSRSTEQRTNPSPAATGT